MFGNRKSGEKEHAGTRAWSGEAKGMLSDDMLDGVIGGVVTDPQPTPTGGAGYKCPKCGTNIPASTRDMYVTCPNLGCRTQYKIVQGELVPR